MSEGQRMTMMLVMTVVALAVAAVALLVAAVLQHGRLIELRRVEHRQHARIERLQDLLDTSSDWAWEVDSEIRYSYVSPQVKHLLGYEPEELLGKSPYDLMPRDEARRVGEVFMTCMVEDRPIKHLRNVNLHKDGRLVILETSATAIHDREGRLAGYRGIDRDITDRGLIEEQLAQAQKMESVGQLAGGLAHDFNNMLGGIIGAAELLKMEIAEAGGDEHLTDIILDAATRAADVTGKLLTFSRKRKIAMVPVDAHVAVLSAVELVRHSMDPRVTIDLDLAARHAVVAGDAALLQSAFLNLMLNARDAMPMGGRLAVTTVNDVHAPTAEDLGGTAKPHGNVLVITVKDNGIGMGPDTLPHIFEPFFSTKDTGQGTGLGLPGVYGTVTDHQGMIDVQSVKGEGTAFKITIPVAPDRGREPEIEEAGDMRRGEGRCILVVDDEELVRSVLGEHLRRQGYEVLSAVDGVEGLELYRANAAQIDTVIMDAVMPRMNGEECIKQIRAFDPDARIILSSGHYQSHEFGPVDTHGLAGVLAKPYRMKDVLKLLRQPVESTED